jgi:hypothetical protein
MLPPGRLRTGNTYNPTLRVSVEHCHGDVVASEAVESLRSRWVSTSDVSALLQVSDRQVRNFVTLERRKVQGSWQYLESDVLAERAARMSCGMLRKPPEASGNTDSGGGASLPTS